MRRAHLDVRVRERAGELGAEGEGDVAVLEDAGLRELLGHVAARGALGGGLVPACLTAMTRRPDSFDLGRGVPDRRVRDSARRFTSVVIAVFGTEK